MKLKPCPICKDDTCIEEDWDRFIEGTVCSQDGYIDCKNCGFGITYQFNTNKDGSDDFWSEKLRQIWDKLNEQKSNTVRRTRS